MTSQTIAQEFTFSGVAKGEVRYFPEEGKYGNTEKLQPSFVIEPQAMYSWDNDRQVTTVIPYLRVDEQDNERTHFDLREMSYVGAFNNIETRIGVSKVFWGVTESYHLVDVINQSDFVDNIDGEDKLGQPMVNLSYLTDYGTFTGFALPYFRERTFSGSEGRFRGPLVVNTDKVQYMHVDGQNHTDYALRWSHYFGDFELGLSYFNGTNRDPFFKAISSTEIAPIYTQMEQYSIDSQYIYENWLLKTEMIVRDSQLEQRFFSTVTGFEYTFSNIKQTGLDVGVLAEWLYDERGTKTQTPFYDHTFIGTRIALNDVKSTEILAGMFVNNHDMSLTSYRIEAERRINENWKWEVNANIIHEPAPVSGLYLYEKDSYIEASISFYW
ncbi:hypothetical protein A9Q84_00800 [Halobacteriovorax marinus]|uniref:Uncharacterized protein n=1 Tax=Halobacteriovorax marinus TaxID=97084 RepID=A0A1Y5FJN5_9BACT|nr:hypothetical protein A9Q84_00800 [Halobacteriovorax marinus]